MLVQAYKLEINMSPHSSEEFEYEAIAYVDADLSQTLPYLNAVLPRGIYLPDAPALSWRYENHNICFWPDRIAVDHLESREEAEELVEKLVALVNRVWERRQEIQPDFTTHRPPQPLEVYKLLPGLNCGKCGENSCFNFALKLASGQSSLENCPPLNEKGFEEKKGQLEKLLGSRWPEGWF